MSVSENIRQIEEFTDSWRLELEEEKKELEERHKKFSDLLAVFEKSLATGSSMKALDNINFLPPSNSVIHSIFKDEDPGTLVIHSDREAKKKQLAEERRAEYNAFLQKKENELFLKRKNFEERNNVTPKSLLDFVDYEKVLARRKEEEARFRPGTGLGG
ncbi:uncharacterized protein LOC129216830 [Uloborus diversus]|uniref:uncharacterized protein LOC129216830 n=1 Tax=Uloborus diversus TaxID=327109 RepID=UPI00240901F2|nr:uncharacterized protein LOC129216830 [Uloborus diversus]